LKRFNNKYSHSKANWNKFKGTIENSFDNIDFEIIISIVEQLDKTVVEITEIIHSAIDQTTQRKKHFQKSVYRWISRLLVTVN
jgi:hypothetical protein